MQEKALSAASNELGSFSLPLKHEEKTSDLPLQSSI
jgi:hypothetical protein